MRAMWSVALALAAVCGVGARPLSPHGGEYPEVGPQMHRSLRIMLAAFTLRPRPPHLALVGMGLREVRPFTFEASIYFGQPPVLEGDAINIICRCSSAGTGVCIATRPPDVVSFKVLTPLPPHRPCFSRSLR